MCHIFCTNRCFLFYLLEPHNTSPMKTLTSPFYKARNSFRVTHLPWASLCRVRAPSQEVWFWLSRLVFFSNISASLSSPCCHLHLLFRNTSWILVFLHFNFFRLFPYIYLYISDIVVLASVITMMNYSLICLISLLHTIIPMF